MKRRCYDKRHKDYQRYGARGITVCASWMASFESFFESMGPRPPGTSLDRKDSRRGYEPGNVRWATRTQQQRNRRTACDWRIGERTFPSLKEAATHFGVSVQSVARWVHGQFDARRGTFTPPKEGCYAISRY